MTFQTTKQKVSNRGVPPDSFLDELVAWGRTAPDEIFAPNPYAEVYSNIVGVLGPSASSGRDVRSNSSSRRL
jgi:hypothetical protein